MGTQHNVNEDYSNYIKRRFLKDHRVAVWVLTIIIIISILSVFTFLIGKTGLEDSDTIFTIVGWVFIILAFYLGYKFFKKYYIPKRRYTRSELRETYE